MKRYAVVIEKAPGNYSAYVPDLPGSITTGGSVQEVERLIREAIAFHLDGMRADGDAIPEPTTLVTYAEVTGPVEPAPVETTPVETLPAQ